MNRQDTVEPYPSTRLPKQPTAHEFIVVLSRIYSDAGLPAREAYLSAVADYECSFGQEVVSLS